MAKLTKGEQNAISAMKDYFFGNGDFEGYVHRVSGTQAATMLNLQKKGFLKYQKTITHTYETIGQFGMGNRMTHRQFEVRYTVTDKFINLIK